MIRHFIYSILFLVSLITYAQEPVTIHITPKDGLPDKEFYNIIEDSSGFIWLCADKGLFRFDGKTYKNYSNKEKRGLSVFNVLEDNLGRIWCNNISGQFFYVENNTLHTFIDLSKTLNGELVFFTVDKDHLIVYTQNKIIYIGLDTKRIEKTYSTNSTLSIPKDFRNETYIATRDSIALLDNKNGLNYLFPIGFPSRDKYGVNLIDGQTYVFTLDSQLFFRQFRAGKNTFFKINLDEKQVELLEGFEAVSNLQTYSVFKNKNQFWVSTSNGVYVYNWDDNQFKIERQFLKGKNVTKIIKDKDDNYWFITLNHGIYVMPNIYIEDFNISQNAKNISALDKINNHALIFGSSNGNVGLYDLKNGKEKIIEIPNTTRVSALKYSPKAERSYIGKDRNLFILDHKTHSVISTFSISSVKNFLILDNNDVHLVDHKSAVLLKNKDSKSELLSKNKRPYTSFYNKKSKTVYVAYVDGLVKYDALWNPKSILHNNTPIYGLSISQTTDSVLWVATFKDGVYGLKKDTVIAHFTTKNGLISNRIEKIKADGNQLWIATDSGIQLLETKARTFKTLTKNDGIVSYHISGIAVLEDKVVFGSSDGLFSVNKQNVFKPQKAVTAYFTSVEINEKDMPLSNSYQLDYNQNAIKFSFNVNGLQFNKKGKYKYRLLGFNKDWITTATGETSVKYNSLPAGHYTFQVQPQLDEATEDNKIIALNFSIKKPFWKRWWFILGSAVLVFGLIVLYFRSKVKKEAQQRKIEVKQLSLDNELIALKLENLRSQMNPHFIFNALNSIQEYIVLNQKKLASEYLGKFADLIRTYLNHSTKGKITLQEEIDCLEMYLELEKLRFEDKLCYTITASSALKTDAILIPTMLVQPYVENALKHGLLHRKDNRKLNINFIVNQNTKLVTCVIVDNGVGRDEARKLRVRRYKTHKPFATKATEDRLKLLNYGKVKSIGVTITDLIEQDKPIGTKVEISIPFTVD